MLSFYQDRYVADLFNTKSPYEVSLIMLELNHENRLLVFNVLSDEKKGIKTFYWRKARTTRWEIFLRDLSKKLSSIILKAILGSVILMSFKVQQAAASISYMDQLSVAMGLTMSSFAQLEGAVDGDISSGSQPSLLSVNINYEIFQFRKFSHVFKMTGTGILMAGIEKYYGMGYGVRWYFGSEGTRVNIRDKVLDVSLTPKFRYYAGANVGGYYYVYRPVADGERFETISVLSWGTCRSYVWKSS